MKLPASVLLLSFLTVLAREPAHACACADTPDFWVTGSGPAPSDLRGAVFFYQHAPGPRRAPDAAHDAARVLAPRMRIERVESGDERHQVRAVVERLGSRELYLVMPAEPMRPGERWRFTYDDPLEGTRELVEEVFPSRIELAILPVALGAESGVATLRVGEPTSWRAVVAAAPRESCKVLPPEMQLPEIRRTVTFELPAALRGIEGALLFFTEVDGQPWKPGQHCVPPIEGRNWQPFGSEIVYGQCPGDTLSEATGPALSGLKMGPHQVSMRAVLPGTGLELRPAPVAFDLRCAAHRPSPP